MDIKEGHPGSIFHWFFDSDQGSDALAHMLFMIYGSKADAVSLSRACLTRKEEFNDVLGPEILFLFFDPDTPVHQLSEDGCDMQSLVETIGPARFLFAGQGEARAVPSGMIEVGKERFRSEDTERYHDETLTSAAAKANGRAVPFFQQTFSIPPGQSSFIFCLRKSREIAVFDLGETIQLTADDLIKLFRSIRPMARRPNQRPYFADVCNLVQGRLDQSSMKFAFHQTWSQVRAGLKAMGFDVS